LIFEDHVYSQIDYFELWHHHVFFYVQPMQISFHFTETVFSPAYPDKPKMHKEIIANILK